MHGRLIAGSATSSAAAGPGRPAIADLEEGRTPLEGNSLPTSGKEGAGRSWLLAPVPRSWSMRCVTDFAVRLMYGVL